MSSQFDQQIFQKKGWRSRPFSGRLFSGDLKESDHRKVRQRYEGNYDMMFFFYGKMGS